MRTSKGDDYRSDLDELDQYRMKLKQKVCPHCRAVGFLIGHGFLRGYGENSREKEIRGRRFFCSNRDRRRGCGRTFSVLLADRLGGFMLPATTLWSFLQGVRSGLTRKATWERLKSSLSLESAYRIWNRFQQAQSHIRTRLAHHGDASIPTETSNPLFELIDHLMGAFPMTSCPIAAFQTQFQTPFLP